MWWAFFGTSVCPLHNGGIRSTVERRHVYVHVHVYVCLHVHVHACRVLACVRVRVHAVRGTVRLQEHVDMRTAATRVFSVTGTPVDSVIVGVHQVRHPARRCTLLR